MTQVFQLNALTTYVHTASIHCFNWTLLEHHSKNKKADFKYYNNWLKKALKTK